MDNSKFWLKYEPKGKFTLLELVNTQRAITNFTKILTGKEIKVDFHSNNDSDSMTNGKRITLSSVISLSTIDSVVGLALHEAAHCKYTDFNVLKHLNNTLYSKNIQGAREIISTLLNFIEDRRIDSLVYQNAPGYQGYYRSMYERYFYSKIVNKALKGSEYREENWESYLFRIINIFNKNTDFNALKCLSTIFNIIDLKNIDRLKNTKDSLDLAIELYKILLHHFNSMTPKQRKIQVKQNKRNISDKSPLKEEIKKSFRKQEQFINGKIYKAPSSKKELNQMETISKSNIKESRISAIDKNGVKRTNRKVHIIDGINDSLAKNNLYGIFKYPNLADHNNINIGINLGKKLLNKLKITNEQVTLASKRLKSGKIDTKRIYSASFENNIFYKINKSNYKPVSIHLSIDGSGSMQGEKWDQVLVNTVALGYISLYMQNIDLTISIRTTGKENKEHIPLLILAFNSKKHTLSDLKKISYYKVSGLTPEGMCLNTLNEYIPNSSYYLDSYLINMSDGFPTFESNGFIYKGKSAILDTAKAISNIKKKGVKVLSYFIETDVTSNKLNELVNSFKNMYGKSATFIDPKNINQITKTLNNLFLKRDLIS
tara:strand:+ start:67 stop:1869 length:1803 start_codon:yes stop_codon:yes gene_type:complete